MTRNRALTIALVAVAVAALVISALVLALSLTSDDATSSGGDPFTNAEDAGCVLSTQTYDTEELYVQDARRCRNGGVFYVFGNNKGRDAWVEAATTFGTVVTESGDRWVYVEEQ